MDCPEPVIKVKKAVETEGLTQLKVLLNSESSKQNVSRLARTMGFTFTLEENGAETVLTMSKESVDIQDKPEAKTASENGKTENITIFISSNVMGNGSDELGGKLMNAFLGTIKEVKPLPRTILFVNGGVKLTTEDTPLIQELQNLEDRGVDIYSCGACLEHFDIMDNLKVGQVGNMLVTTEALFHADKVIKL